MVCYSVLHFVHCRALNLDRFLSSITTKSYDDEKSWLSTLTFSRPPDLNFDGNETQLSWPFLLAQLDYDPGDQVHRRMLQTIYQVVRPLMLFAQQ
jgi:hypothetical protein